MDAPARRAAPHIGCGLGARFLLERHIVTGLTLLIALVVSLPTVRFAAAAKESRNTCEEIKMLHGVENATASLGRVFFYPISPFAFQGKITHYKITLTNGTTLPKWLEYNHNTNTLQGVPVLEESEEYYLTVFAYGEVCDQRIPTANATFALHVQGDILINGKEISTYQTHGTVCSGAQCVGGLSVTFAEIIIKASSPLEIQDQIDLICTMAEYLHLDVSLLTLAPFKDSFKKHLWNLTILAEEIRYIKSTRKHFIGLSWPVGVGVFTMFYELVRVLQHNVESESLSRLLGYETVGWRVLKKEGHVQKHLWTRHTRNIMATPRTALRPTKTENSAYLLAPVLETQPFVVSPSREISPPLYEATTKAAVLADTDVFLYSVMSPIDIQAGDRPRSLHGQPKPPAPSILQNFFSELLPSLISPTTELTDKVVSQTPPFLEQQQFRVPQVLYSSTPQPSEHMHNSTLNGLVSSVPVRKSEISMAVHFSPEVAPSMRSSSPAHFAEETRSLDGSDPYKQLTVSILPSQETTSIAKHSLPFMDLRDLRASPEYSFFSIAMSALLSCGSYQTPEVFSNDKYGPGTLISSQLTAQQMEVSRWNMDFSLTDIASTFEATAASGPSAHRLGWLPTSTSAAALWCYSDNGLPLPMYTTQDFSLSSSLFDNVLEFGLLSKRNNIPAFLLSWSLSTPMELTSFGHGSMFPTEDLLSRGKQDDPEVIRFYVHAPDTFMTDSQTYKQLVTKDKVAAINRSYTKTSLEKTLIYVTESKATLSSRWLPGEEFSPGVRWTSDQYSYEALLRGHSAESFGTPDPNFPTNEHGFYDSNVIKTHETYLNVLQLDTRGLSLDGSFRTNVNFQMAEKVTSKVMEQSVFPSDNKIPTETGFYATTLYHGSQGEPNNSPIVVNAIKWITATIGHRFSFSIPPDTFYDQEDGDTSHLMLGMSPKDGSPRGPECWLQFNSSYQTMHGYPLHNDFQYSPQEFLLFATDSGGLWTLDTFTIEMLRPASTPCHRYTVRTKNSYYSFLRNRGRVNLFFEKLTQYLSVGNPGNVVLLHLEPGSTVVTCYSQSSCTRADRCARNEIQDVLAKLGAPDGRVNQNFVEAMLPDFKIYQIENVVYSGTCLPTVKPLNESLTSNITITNFKDSHSWVRNRIFTLFISLCTSVMVIMILLLHYCKHRKKMFSLRSASDHKRHFSYIDLEMNMLKSRKTPLLEQNVPPVPQFGLPPPPPSQHHLGRSNQNLVPLRIPPPPPKYRLPPPYGKEETSQIHHMK